MYGPWQIYAPEAPDDISVVLVPRYWPTYKRALEVIQRAESRNGSRYPLHPYRVRGRCTAPRCGEWTAGEAYEDGPPLCYECGGL